MEGELLELEERYYELRARYPEAHPRVQEVVAEYRRRLRAYEMAQASRHDERPTGREGAA